MLLAHCHLVLLTILKINLYYVLHVDVRGLVPTGEAVYLAII